MSWWNYLLLVNIYLVLFFGFYALLLRRETFFQLNRIYLVSSALLSFFIPMIQSDWVKNLFITQKVQYTFYGSAAVNITAYAPIKDTSYTVGELLVMLYLAGVVVLALRLMWQFVLLRRVIKQATPSAPYSFFNKINVDANTAGKEVIIAHEEVHARQWHSADVLIIEAVMIINWFNPVVYLYRFAIKNIHEYIADRQALQTGTSKADYAMLLLSQTFNAPAHRLVNPFYNHSLLKQRIMMLQKDRSARLKLLKYGLSAPLFMLMLVLSSATISNSKAVISINKNAEHVFLKPASEMITIDEPLPNTDAIDEEVPVADTTKKNRSKIYTSVSQAPKFPGGEAAFARFLGKTIRYPKDARENNIQGRVVLTFVVEKNGALSDIKVVRKLGHGTDEEAVRAMKASPKWIPGKVDGKLVRVQYAVPISFALAEEGVASAKTTKDSDSALFTAVEVPPGFPGGTEAFTKYLSKSIKYPQEARANKTQGKVIASFIVDEDGSVKDVKVIKGIGDGADEEAVRVLKAMPKWTPGIQNGRAVRVQYTAPISFNLGGTNGALQGSLYNSGQSENLAQTLTYRDTAKKGGNASAFGINPGPEPLYIVDGKEVKNLALVTPETIESISVFKDKSTTLIYGEKGANGVVVITTKKKVKK